MPRREEPPAKKMPTLHETILVGLPKVAVERNEAKQANKPKTAREAITQKVANAPKPAEKAAPKKEPTLEPS